LARITKAEFFSNNKNFSSVLARERRASGRRGVINGRCFGRGALFRAVVVPQAAGPGGLVSSLCAFSSRRPGKGWHAIVRASREEGAGVGGGRARARRACCISRLALVGGSPHEAAMSAAKGAHSPAEDDVPLNKRTVSSAESRSFAMIARAASDNRCIVREVACFARLHPAGTRRARLRLAGRRAKMRFCLIAVPGCMRRVEAACTPHTGELRARLADRRQTVAQTLRLQMRKTRCVCVCERDVCV